MMATDDAGEALAIDKAYEAPTATLQDRITNHATVARIEIDLYEQHARLYADLCGREMKLEANRPARKQAAVLRLLQEVNPASGDGNKKYSATAAESAAALDHEYRAHLALQSEVVVAKHDEKAKAEAAKLRAQLEIAMLKAEAGVQ